MSALVLPTHVGVILKDDTADKKVSSTTHTRGGDPKLEDISMYLEKYYPHTWG